MNNIELLVQQVTALHAHGAYHIKRGFRITDLKPATISNHLIEEAVELQAEILDDGDSKVVTEASHVLAVFLHLLQSRGITLDRVAASASDMLKQHFTTNKSEITAHAPGTTRSGRNNSPLIHSLLRLQPGQVMTQIIFSNDFKLQLKRCRADEEQGAFVTFVVWSVSAASYCGHIRLLPDDLWVGLPNDSIVSPKYENAHDALYFVLNAAGIGRPVTGDNDATGSNR